MSGVEEVVTARAAWSRLVEPGDTVAGAVVAALGPVDALRWLRSAVADPVSAGPATLPLPPSQGRRLAAAVRRWAPRLDGLDPGRDLAAIDRLGGGVLVPEGPSWPARLEGLGAAAPACLWVRGTADLASVLSRSVAVVGARASTSYGEHVTGELAAGLAGAGWTVLSGGAYGIDAVAHRGALAGGGRTVAVLAGGVDRLYPASNARLLRAVVDDGAVVSEVPPGGVPSRSRFLQRNRLIAAMSAATVVVEAAWRSGALSTAGHAAQLLRPVGAVPGPITSAASAGCHRLLRDGAAVCVTDLDEVLELVAPLGRRPSSPRTGRRAEVDGLTDEARRTLDALPVRQTADVERLARVAGLSAGEVLAALGPLELAGLAVRGVDGWRRRRRDPSLGQNGTKDDGGGDELPGTG